MDLKRSVLLSIMKCFKTDWCRGDRNFILKSEPVLWSKKKTGITKPTSRRGGELQIVHMWLYTVLCVNNLTLVICKTNSDNYGKYLVGVTTDSCKFTITNTHLSQRSFQSYRHMTPSFFIFNKTSFIRKKKLLQRTEHPNFETVRESLEMKFSKG